MIKWLIPLLSIAVGLFTCLLPLFTFKGEDKEIYSPLRYYPYEAGSGVKGKVSLLACAMVFAVGAGESYASYLLQFRTPFFISALILYIVSLLAFLALTMYGLNYLKAHLVADAVFFFGEIGGDLMMFLGYMFAHELEAATWLRVIYVVVGLGLIVLLSLPKMRQWAYMEKHESDGKVYYDRPRMSLLAFSEWIFFYGELLNMVLLMVEGIILA
jgi:hypothetical protein